MRLYSTAIPAAPSLALSRRLVRAAIISCAALALVGCSDASKAWFDNRLSSLQAGAAKIKELAPAYCRIRPQTSLDDLALAAIALATSEKAADAIKAGVDKVCSWVGEPPAPSATTLPTLPPVGG